MSIDRTTVRPYPITRQAKPCMISGENYLVPFGFLKALKKKMILPLRVKILSTFLTMH